MENDEFKTKLKEALEAFDARISQLEHLVNDTIIGSLESAAQEYEYEDGKKKFDENYGESLKDLVEPYKKLFGEDYDLSKELYDDLRATEGYGTEGFDEASTMAARIDDLKARIEAIKSPEVIEKVEEAVDEAESEAKEDEEKKDEGEISEEQLAEEFQEALEEGRF